MRLYQIEEAIRPAYYYHGTPYADRIVNIIKSGYIKPSSRVERIAPYISLTRNKKYAEGWAERNGGVFYIDGEKLLHNHKKPKPFSWSLSNINEYEERVYQDIDLSCVVAISLPHANYSFSHSDFESNLKMIENELENSMYKNIEIKFHEFTNQTDWIMGRTRG